MDAKYAFWNNKGGTGKTSLAFQSVCYYAEKHPEKKILVVDICPQANLSELFLGGITNNGSTKLLERQGLMPRCSLGGYFQLRLPSPYVLPIFNAQDFISKPIVYNRAIPKNVDLVCGDPLLELQANAINTLSNQHIPSTNTWIAIIDWLKDFLDKVKDQYDTVFMDCNPSFSLYTQIALATADKLILPVMADDSSRRALQNAFSLIYGLKLPLNVYASYAFDARLSQSNRPLPKVHLLVKNRLTQYMVPGSGYEAVFQQMQQDVQTVLKSNPTIFTANKDENFFVDVRDFQTAGIVAFARGLPFSKLVAGKQTVGGHRVQVKEEYRINCISAIKKLVSHL